MCRDSIRSKPVEQFIRNRDLEEQIEKDKDRVEKINEQAQLIDSLQKRQTTLEKRAKEKAVSISNYMKNYETAMHSSIKQNNKKKKK